MNTTLFFAVGIVTVALVLYTIAVIAEQRAKAVTRTFLVFLTAGVIFDISATVVMIMGSRNIPITPHGFLGYSALTVMIIETVLIWRLFRRRGIDCLVPGKLNWYTRLAYGWWVIAYVAGAVVAMTMGK